MKFVTLFKRMIEKRKAFHAARRAKDDAFDDQNLTPWQRTKQRLRRGASEGKWYALPIAAAGLLYGAGVIGNARVSVLDEFDVNGDGIKDGIVVYPLKGTRKGLVSYIDGKDLPNLKTVLPQNVGPDYCPQRDVVLFRDVHLLGVQLTHRGLSNSFFKRNYVYVGNSPSDRSPNKERNAKGEPIFYLVEGSEFGDTVRKLGVIKK